MKFGNALQKSAAYSEAVADLHATYKAAKKLLKCSNSHHKLATLLADKIEKWNDLFFDVEEDMVIKCSDLGAECESFDSMDKPERVALVQELVNFHGRLILFLHWCMLAQTTVMKMVKKCNKKLGGPRMVFDPHAFMADSCCSTDVTSQLLATTEQLIAKHGAGLGICICPPAAAPAAQPLLQRCCTGRTPACIQQAAAQLQKHQAMSMTDDEDDDDSDEHAASSSSQPAASAGEQAPQPAAAAGGPLLVAQLLDALQLWEELKANARTPSTVLRPPPELQGLMAAAGQAQGQGPAAASAAAQRPCCCE